jgi:hypothetical protein
MLTTAPGRGYQESNPAGLAPKSPTLFRNHAGLVDWQWLCLWNPSCPASLTLVAGLHARTSRNLWMDPVALPMTVEIALFERKISGKIV